MGSGKQLGQAGGQERDDSSGIGRAKRPLRGEMAEALEERGGMSSGMWGAKHCHGLSSAGKRALFLCGRLLSEVGDMLRWGWVSCPTAQLE